MRRFTFIIAAILGTLGGAALRVCADNGAPVPAKSVARVFPERFRVWGATGPTAPATDGADSSAAVAAEAGLLERMTRVYSDGKQQVSLTIAVYARHALEQPSF